MPDLLRPLLPVVRVLFLYSIDNKRRKHVDDVGVINGVVCHGIQVLREGMLDKQFDINTQACNSTFIQIPSSALQITSNAHSCSLVNAKLHSRKATLTYQIFDCW